MLEIEASRNRPFITRLTEHLSNANFKDALQLFQDDSQSDIIKENSWDIVPIVSSHISAKNAVNNTELFHCCETILNLISEKCNPSETILELLEQIEHSENDVKFCAMFRPLSTVMQKISGKAKAIEWCTSTIRSYIDGIDLPGNNETDGNNESEGDKFENTSQFASRVDNVYNAILAFLEPLVQEAVSNKAQSNSNDIMKHHLASLLIFLLGKPFCYLNEDRKTSNFVSQLAQRIATLVSLLVSDLLQFLHIVRKRANQTSGWKNFHLNKESYSLEIILFEFPENAPQLAYANFYFYVFTVPTLCKKVPHVYSPQYIFQSCLCLINNLLENSEVVIVTKGLGFMEHRLQGIEKYSVTSDMLDLTIYIDIIQTLVKIMIYCSSRKHRIWALDIFKNYFEIFDMECRYLIISNLYKKSEHSGFLSLVTSLLKAAVIECLDTVPKLPYFLGNNLKSLLKLACTLPHGSTSDLVELSDEIITNLNLLRFLFLRDRNNDTGIWNMVEDLDREFLKPLREGISLCKAHWGVKIKDLEEQTKLNKNGKSEEFEGNDTKVTLIVGGEKLPPMSLNQKILFCRQAFNALDIMECLLIRINECIASIRSLWTSRILFTEHTENVNTQDTASNESDEAYEKNIKTNILNASLNYVNDLGWSQEAISAGAESIGYPGIIHGMFPNRGADLVHHFYSKCNKELNKILQERDEGVQEVSEKEKQAFEQQLQNAVEIRLRMLVPYKKVWPQALGLMALPQNVPMSLANLLTLVDDICYYSGDRSVDINWYARRVVLAGIYKTTELYMLQDGSEDHTLTWRFLERRISDATQINAILTATGDTAFSEQMLGRTTETAKTVFSTARNILGLNWNR